MKKLSFGQAAVLNMVAQATSFCSKRPLNEHRKPKPDSLSFRAFEGEVSASPSRAVFEKPLNVHVPCTVSNPAQNH